MVLHFHNNHVSDTFENKHVAGQSKKKVKTVWFVDHASPVFGAVVAKNNRLGHKASATTNLANNLAQQENEDTKKTQTKLYVVFFWRADEFDFQKFYVFILWELGKKKKISIIDRI